MEEHTGEGNLISKNDHKNLLNRKGKWGKNLPPKLTLMDKEQIRGSKRVGAPVPQVQPQGGIAPIDATVQTQRDPNPGGPVQQRK